MNKDDAYERWAELASGTVAEKLLEENAQLSKLVYEYKQELEAARAEIARLQCNADVLQKLHEEDSIEYNKFRADSIRMKTAYDIECERADELRHERDELQAKLDALEKQEPVGVFCEYEEGCFEQMDESFLAGTPLYAAAGAV